MFTGIASTELHNRYKDLMAKFNAMRIMADAARLVVSPPPIPIPPKFGITINSYMTCLSSSWKPNLICIFAEFYYCSGRDQGGFIL